MPGQLQDSGPHPGHDTGADPAETTQRLIGCLLSDRVQLRAGPCAGGVLGWFDPETSVRFAYPEITGYYLTFLSFLNAEGWPPGAIEPLAQQAAEWLGRQCAAGRPPATRVYLGPSQPEDWRNRLSFSFDLAMIRRGLAVAGQRIGAARADCIRLAVERHLSSFCAPEGGLLASLVCCPGPIPPAWSVHAGPFQLKAAAALLDSSGRCVARATIERCRNWMPESGRPELLHPSLYFVEGALLAGVADRDDQLLHQAALALQRLVEFCLLSSRADPLTRFRSEVLAQILRCGCLLRAGSYLPSQIWDLLLPELAASLCQYCGPAGEMYFRRDDGGRLRHVNIWSGLFAAQALIWYGQWRTHALPLAAAAWLV